MATYKLNIARIRGCPPPEQLAAALETFGLPEEDEFGVLNHSLTQRAVFGTVVRKVQQAVQRLDAEAKEVTAAAVDKVQVYPFAVRPDAEALEIYAGGAAGIDQLAAFLSGSLGLPIAVEQIELDVAGALEKLMTLTERFQLRSVRVADYAHNSYMAGPYAPKFLDTEHGREFLEEYGDAVLAASVRFSAPTARATASLTPKCCFSFSCHEDDRPVVQSILRKLV